MGYPKMEDEDKIMINNMTIQDFEEFKIKAVTSPEELIKMVASKGGTTEAGLEALRLGLPFQEAVDRAFKRAGELEKRS